MHPIRIGTCGWSYKDWVGPFYPKGTGAGDYLSLYAQRFGIVEVDSTFYATPRPQTVEAWRERTPAGFSFSLKVPQVITHEKRLVDARRATDEFLAVARLLGDKLRCCLLQFCYFNRKMFTDRDDFLSRLDTYLGEWPADVPVAVEIRNKAWLGPALAECLRRHRAVWALSDQEWMPAPISTVQQWDTVTGPFGYLRLIGNRAEVEKQSSKFDRVVVDRTEQLRMNARAIHLLSEREPVEVFVNNHFAGHAPSTIEQLQEMLRSGEW